MLSDAVRARVEAELPAGARAAALAALERMGEQLRLWRIVQLTDRVEHAVLDLAEGDPAALERHVGHALRDWRDVLVAAGR